MDIPGINKSGRSIATATARTTVVIIECLGARFPAGSLQPPGSSSSSAATQPFTSDLPRDCQAQPKAELDKVTDCRRNQERGAS
jgi:hypothetical protein